MVFVLLKSGWEDMVMNPNCDPAVEPGLRTVINRSWTIFNCMGLEIAGPIIQQIKIFDTTPPSTMNCPADVTISTGSNSCLGATLLTFPDWTDNCSTIDVVVTADNGSISGNIIFDLPIGTTVVTFTATDDCGNVAICEYDITVEDQVPPSVTCDGRTVSLGMGGTTMVSAETLAGIEGIDMDYWDHCGDVSVLAARMEGSQCPDVDATPLGTHVPFYCL